MLRFLEIPAGSFMTWGVVTSVPGVTVAVALLQHSTAPVKVLITGETNLGLLILVVVGACAMSLIRAIDTSLQERQDAMVAEGSLPLPRSKGDLVLLASRKKIKTYIVTTVPQVIIFDPVLRFVTFSKLGEAAPFAPVRCPPRRHASDLANVHMFSNRSKVRQGEQSVLRSMTGALLPASWSSWPGVRGITSMFGTTQQVVPIEAS